MKTMGPIGKKLFRKKLLIYPRFQLTLIALNTAILAIIFGLISFQVASVLKNLKQTGSDLHLDITHPYFNFIQMETGLFNRYLTWGFFFSAIISSAAILIISHRVAGPIVRLREYFKSISENGTGSLGPLQFRAHDFFSDLPPYVNQAFEKTNQQAS